MSDFRTDDDLWDGGLPEETDDAVGDFDGIDDDLDELGGPPSEFKKGRRSRYKFTMTPQWVLLMTELTHPAFRLYCLMVAHVNTDRGDQLVWPQQKTLAKMLGYKRRASLDPLIKLLVKLELIEVEDKRYGHNNSRRRNVYTVHEEPPRTGRAGLRSRSSTPPRRPPGVPRWPPRRRLRLRQVRSPSGPPGKLPQARMGSRPRHPVRTARPTALLPRPATAPRRCRRSPRRGRRRVRRPGRTRARRRSG